MATKVNFTGQTLTIYSARKHFVQNIRNGSVPTTNIMQISRHKNVQSVLNYSQNMTRPKQLILLIHKLLKIKVLAI